MRGSDVPRIRSGYLRHIPGMQTGWIGHPHEIALSRETMQVLLRLRVQAVNDKDNDYIFPFCSRTVTNRIKAAVKAAGYEGAFGSDSPQQGMMQELYERYGVPARLRDSHLLAVALAPRYVFSQALSTAA